MKAKAKVADDVLADADITGALVYWLFVLMAATCLFFMWIWLPHVWKLAWRRYQRWKFAHPKGSRGVFVVSVAVVACLVPVVHDWDSDGDGDVDLDDLYHAADRNHDGVLSRSEIAIGGAWAALFFATTVCATYFLWNALVRVQKLERQLRAAKRDVAKLQGDANEAERARENAERELSKSVALILIDLILQSFVTGIY